MRDRVKRFVSLRVGLKELQRFVVGALGDHLQTGKPLKSMGDMRSREAWANWLLCAATNHWAGEDRLTFTSDPRGGDGVIVDLTTGETWPTEHILVPRRKHGDLTALEDLILRAVEKKVGKGGAAYASGKTLVVFLNAGGDGAWMPNRVARRLPADSAFEAIWVVALQTIGADGSYNYAVTRLDLERGNAPTWGVHIASDFESWTVSEIQ